FWLLSGACQCVAALVSIPLSPVEAYVRYMTHGRWSIYMDLLGHDPHKPLASPFPEHRWASPSETRAALPSGHTKVGELPEHAASIGAASDNVQVFPVLTPALEEKMKTNPDCNASIIFIGTYGS